MLRSFLPDFMRNIGSALTLIVMDEAGMHEPRTYRVEPKRLLVLAGVLVLAVGLLMVLLVVATPIRGLIPGLATEGMREEAQRNAQRLQAMEDSLASQDAYLAQLRDLVLGRVEPGERAAPLSEAEIEAEVEDLAPGPPGGRPGGLPRSIAESDAAWPGGEPGLAMPAPAGSFASVPGLRFPVVAPVAGVFTRGYSEDQRHYAVDFAAEQGSPVSSVGDGRVLFADWTHDAGHVIVVQHADGFVSVYKHNDRLLRRPGDRVSARETIAFSGNTGELTTGPHLHFELWRNGSALDPREYIVGL